MNALEELEIYNAYSNDSSREFVSNEQLNFESNRLYDTALRLLNENQSVADNTWMGAHSTASAHNMLIAAIL